MGVYPHRNRCNIPVAKLSGYRDSSLYLAVLATRAYHLGCGDYC